MINNFFIHFTYTTMLQSSQMSSMKWLSTLKRICDLMWICPFCWPYQPVFYLFSFFLRICPLLLWTVSLDKVLKIKYIKPICRSFTYNKFYHKPYQMITCSKCLWTHFISQFVLKQAHQPSFQIRHDYCTYEKYFLVHQRQENKSL